MKDNKLIISEMLKIESMPKIFYQLEEVGKYIDENLKDLENLECTEENKIEVKRRRLEINNTLKQFEDVKKRVKEQILEPFALFEDKYTKEVKTRLETAENMLKTKIDEIETNQKVEKELILRDFFNEYQTLYHLENIITFENVGLNITLSASEKSLKEQIVAYCEKINNDIMAIGEDVELMHEYKMNGLDYAKAVVTKKQREEEINKLKEEIKKVEQQNAIDQKVIQNVNTLVSKPIEIKEIVDEEILEITFTCKATKEKFKKLKEFMKENGIQYE